MKIRSIFLTIGLSVFAGLIGFFYALLQHPFIPLASILIHPEQEGATLLDDEGNFLHQFKNNRRMWVSFHNIPEVVINACIAAEDRTFFSHNGISWKGILRSCYVNIIKRQLVQGASTITQQLVRLIFLSQKRTFFRKFKEIFMALSLEKNLSKQQIMELYLNNIYFGRGIYGIEAAAQIFWDKPVTLLNAAEGATLAAVAKSARYFSPLNDPKRALQRRNIILNLMKKEKYISPEICQTMLLHPLINPEKIKTHNISHYYIEWIRYWFEQNFDHEMLYHQKLTIYTTLNKKIQNNAEHIFYEQMKLLRQNEEAQLDGGLIIIQGKTGEIKATIGGFNFKDSQFNRCFQAYRQMGSTFKPFLYASALMQGVSFIDVDIDEPFSMQLPNKTEWAPQNWNKLHAGSMTFARALVRSNNIIAAKLLQKIGYEPLISIAREAGFSKKIDPFPSLALGTLEATVEEVAAAFNIFAQNGIYAKPFLIACIKDQHGKTIFEQQSYKKQIIPGNIANQINSALKHQISILDAKTQTPKSQIPMIGKTGSTNNAQSMWFVGSTPLYTTAIYIGRDDNKRGAHKKLASKTAYPIWRQIQDIFETKNQNFLYDSALREQIIDGITGQKTDANNKNCMRLLLSKE